MTQLAGYTVTERQADSPDSDFEAMLFIGELHQRFPFVHLLVNDADLEDGLFSLDLVRGLHHITIKPLWV